MTPEQALGNVAAFINLMIQRGGFKDVGEVHSMTEAHNVLAKLLPIPSFVDGGMIKQPEYISNVTNNGSAQYEGSTETTENVKS